MCRRPWDPTSNVTRHALYCSRSAYLFLPPLCIIKTRLKTDSKFNQHDSPRGIIPQNGLGRRSVGAICDGRQYSPLPRSVVSCQFGCHRESILDGSSYMYGLKYFIMPLIVPTDLESRRTIVWNMDETLVSV